MMMKKSTVRIPIRHDGSLTKYGYSTKAVAAARRAALMAAVVQYGWGKVILKLNAIAILTKRTAPKASGVYRADIKWLQKQRAAMAHEE
jgi:hypothetical protein